MENDIHAMTEYKPDLVIGTTPVVQHAKEKAIPSLYFTNLISARPLMGKLGTGSILDVLGDAMNNGDRFKKMRKFFTGVGVDSTSGVWHEDKPEQKEKKLSIQGKTVSTSSKKESIKC
jgi:chlorophyllide a reductase subunit Y